ncbi:MAG TPA: carboxypeptidase-like regulatory domain-containing protein [Longimicrobiales bacterium]
MNAVWLPLLIALAMQTPADAAGGQGSDGAVRGQILDAASAPLAGQRVVLHRVRNAEGATVAETVTGASGEFELPLPTDSDTSAIYFVATTYEGELYIGAPFRSGGDVLPQIVQVGVAGTSATSLLGGGATAQPTAMGRPRTSLSWMLFAIPLLGIAALAIYMLVPHRRVPAERALLIRVAELDERMQHAPAGQRETLREERTRLMTQLRAG